MKKSVLTFSMIIALASPLVCGVEITTSHGTKIQADPLKGVYSDPENSNKSEVWQSSLRAGIIGFLGTLAGSKLKGETGAQVGAVGAGLTNVAWTCGTDQDANWIAQVAGYAAGVIAAWFML